MKSLMKVACIGLLALSTTAYAGNGKNKTTAKKAQQTCCPNCPHPCPPNCPPGCCPKKG